ncbi:MAG: ROK family protein [Clostridia bacterium]|nr:ROK family protein [Clostridia bacterium]
MKPDEKCLALDLGGTKLLVGIVSGAGEIMASRGYPSPLAGGADQRDVAAGMLASLDDFLASHPLEGVTCMGAGVVGRVDNARGLWLEIDPRRCATVELARLLGERCGLPCRVDNDVRCALRAERLFGRGRGLDDFIYVNIGTGIAAGIVTGGHMVKGAHFNGGETGHVAVDISGDAQCPCGRTGCAEAIASGSGLDRRARALRSRYPRTRLTIPEGAPCRAEEIFRLAREGDALCLRLAGDAAEAAAALIQNLVWTFDPEAVALGGGVVADPWMFDQIAQRLTEDCMRFVHGIQLTSLDPRLTGLIGAAMCGFDAP